MHEPARAAGPDQRGASVTGEVRQLSRRLSWLLRHGAGERGLAMDQAGWAEISHVLDALGITREQLDLAVRHNDKRRLQVNGDRIRACQGHSLEGMPVTREALEASWRTVQPTEPLWHGTEAGAVGSIAADGILPNGRTHVHLAPRPNSRVGKRARVELLLMVDPACLAAEGLTVFEAPNGVLLVREVPPGCITGLRAAAAGEATTAERARRLLGLPD
jgi:putative RNA 2'-phosphotransferase